MKRLNDNQKIQLCKDYESGINSPELSTIYGITSGSIIQLLKRRGIAIRAKNNNVSLILDRYSKEQKDEIFSLYSKPKAGIKTVSKLLGIPPNHIRKILISHGISIKTISQVSRKYTLNEHYFSEIDTDEKAYFLGLLKADGNVRKEMNIVSISLAEADKEILEKFNRVLGHDRPLYFEKRREETRQNMFNLYICSSIMCKDLEKWGVVPNKTLLLTWPKWIAPEFTKDLIRGAWDGDGSAHYRQANLKCTTDFALGCQEYLSTLGFNFHVYPQKKNQTKPLSVLVTSGGKNVIKFLNWLYEDATIYMERKYKKYLAIKDIKMPPPDPLSAKYNEDGTPLTPEEFIIRRRLKAKNRTAAIKALNPDCFS